jgi:glyoxylase-like metal-dependent hydrolase (beta-lactamase superfamily II)
MHGEATLVDSPVPVDRTLQDGEIMAEVLAGLQTVYTPGHSPGHTSYWQAEKGILFSGDVIMRMTGNLSLPFAAFTPSMDENKRSIRRVIALEPRIACFGHGQPMIENTTANIRQFAQKVGAI